MDDQVHILLGAISANNTQILQNINEYASLDNEFSNRRQELLDQFEDDQSENTTIIWEKTKNIGWFEDVVPKMSDTDFKNEFRVDRSTFAVIIDEIKEDMTTIDTNFRKAITVEKKVAIALTVCICFEIQFDSM